MAADTIGALWENAGLAEVQWTLLDARPQGALREALESLLPAGALGHCRLHRAKYKPGRHLTTYYEVTARDPATGAGGTRQVEVTWMPPGSADPRGPADELLVMQDLAASRGLAAPFRQLAADAPEWGLRVQVAPLDVRFPQLVRVSDPSYAAEMLRAGLDGSAPAGPYTVTAIRYRPGQRHMLRYDLADQNGRAAGEGTYFAKTYNGDKGAGIYGVASGVANWLASQNAGMAPLRPLAYLAADSAVIYPYLSGTPLSQLLRTPGDETARYLRQIGGALGALHRTPTDLVALQPHSFAKEVKGTVSAAEHIHSLLPETGALIDSVIARTRALYEQLPQEPPGLAYGDFKSDHLWITSGDLTLIDFDTAYLADQAIDIGKFLADLHWWYDGYGADGVEQAQAQFLEGYLPAPERLLRARLYEVLVLVKTTARRVRLFDADWAPRTTRLIAHADTLLRRFEGSLAHSR
jgi:hypothetical protein